MSRVNLHKNVHNNPVDELSSSGMSFVVLKGMIATMPALSIVINMVTMFRLEFADLAIFNGLGPEQLGALSPLLEEVHFLRGTVIFEQGEPANGLYILLQGEVLVRYKPYDGPLLKVAHIEPGGVFGWSTALGRAEYTSGAEALTDGLAYRISADGLHTLCECNPQAGGLLLERLAGVIAERLRTTNNAILDILSQGIDRNGNCGKRNGIL
jgi:CRP-like cAMP-binding protein